MSASGSGQSGAVHQGPGPGQPHPHRREADVEDRLVQDTQAHRVYIDYHHRIN